MKRTKIYFSIFILLLSTILFGCQAIIDIIDPPKKKTAGIDYVNHATDYAFLVRNSTSKNLVAFKNTLQAEYLLGGVPANTTQHGIKKNPDLFSSTGDFAVILITEEQYLSNLENLAALENTPFTRIYAFYNASGTNESIYEISGHLGGNRELTLVNNTEYNVEFRLDGYNGEIVGYAPPNMYNTKLFLNDGEYFIFPVFRKYNATKNEIYSVSPVFSDGDLAGKHQFTTFSFGDTNQTQTIDVSTFLADFYFSTGGSYLIVDNQSSTGAMLFVSSQPQLTSTGVKTINAGQSYMFFIPFDKVPGSVNEYVKSKDITNYSIGAANISTKTIGTFTAEVDKVYQVTVTGPNASNLSVTSAQYVGYAEGISTDDPKFNLEPGTYTESKSIEISTATSGASIRYTIDGTTPSITSGIEYSGPVFVDQSLTLKAVAYKNGYRESTVSSAEYTIKVPVPTMEMDSGTYYESGAKDNTVYNTMSGATVRYTTDGSTPTASYGTVVSPGGTIPIDRSMTLKAVAYKSGCETSDVMTKTYTMICLAPNITPSTDTYNVEQSVTITKSDPSATIRYTTNGTTPSSTSGIVYSGAFTVSSTTTINAVVYRSGWTDSAISSYTTDRPEAVSTPVFGLGSGTYTGQQSTTLSTTTIGTTIRYTIDDSAPTSTYGTVYSVAIPVSASQTVRAIAYKNGFTDSAVASATYTIKAPTPTVEIDSGTWLLSGTVDNTIYNTMSGVSIRYTTDGTTPTSTYGTSVSVNGTIPIDRSMTLKAVAYKSGCETSDVMTKTYTMVCLAPNITPATWTFSAAQSVTITKSDPSATIRYTTNGTTPSSTNGTVYSGAFTVSSTTTVNAVVYRSGWTDSSVQSSVIAITIAETVSTPVFGLGSGTYTGQQSTTLSTTTTGTTIRYTIDGSAPTSTYGTVYSVAIPVSASQTVRAIAYKSGFTDSAVASATYTIKAPTPTVEIDSGTWLLSGTVDNTIYNTMSGVSIRYTTDGTTPTSTYGTSVSVNGTIPIDRSMTLKAVAYKSGCETSDVMTKTYTLTCVAPTISPATGTFSAAQSVTITKSDSLATIRYTTNGTTPSSTNGTVYSGAFTVSSTTTVNAVVYRSGWTDSNSASATMQITQTVESADLALLNLGVSRSSSSVRSFTTCSFDIKNNGPMALSAEGILVEYYLSNDATFGDSDDRKIGDTLFTLNIASGATYSITLSSTGLGYMSDEWSLGLVVNGNYYVYAKVNFFDSSPTDPTSSNNYARISSTISYTGEGGTTIISEGFEGAFPGSWSVGNNNANTVAKWGDNNAKAYTGIWSAFCSDNGIDSRTTYENNLNTYMQRTSVSLAGYGSATLTFKYWMNTEASYDRFEVNVRDQSNSWTNLMTISGNQSDSGWQTKILSMGAYAGQTGLIISFDFVSDVNTVPSGTAGVWVDDISLTAQ